MSHGMRQAYSNRQENIMRSRIPVTLTFAALLVALLAAAPARAELLHVTWVAGDADETNNDCTRAKPCRTFQKALANTVANGEIRVLNQGSFGVLVIDKSISIVGDGVAGIMALKDPSDITQSAIVIAAGASDVINLRGLIIEGAREGVSGISFSSGGALHVQNSVIRGFRQYPDGNGILFAPIGASELYVSDTLVADNGGNLLNPSGDRSGGGIMINPAISATATVVLDRVRVENNLVGIKIFNNSVFATGTTRVTVRDSISAGNLNEGIHIEGTKIQVMIDRSAVLSNGGVGISSKSATVPGTPLPATLHTTLSNSLVWGNKGIGVAITDYGTVDYAKNNIIAGNWPDAPPPPEGSGKPKPEQNISGDQCVASATTVC